MNGPVPVLNADQTVEDWKRILRKLTVSAAAEIVVADFLFDPVCDYGTSVKVLKRVLTAWAEIELSNHGLGANSGHSLVPTSA
jgi:hypothetical protein